MKKAFAAERKNDSSPRTALGTLLIEEGVIDGAQLEEALRLGTESGERLGEVLVRMGWATEEDLARILAHQWNLRCLERSAISFDPNALAKLSREDATTLEALPMRIADDGSLVVAVAEPTEARLFALRSRFGDRIECVVIPKTALDVGLRGDLLAKTSPTRKDDVDPAEGDGFPEASEPFGESVASEPFGEAAAHEAVAVESESFEPENVQPEAVEPEAEVAVVELVADVEHGAAEPEEGDDVDETPPAALAVVADFDEAAGALTSLVEEQLASLRSVVVEAERARVSSEQAHAGAESARTQAESARADAQAEVDRLNSELAERESKVRDLQQNLRDIADRLLPPATFS
jgi:Type II secretion system (T2SS), protein E, N-terminal domain